MGKRTWFKRKPCHSISELLAHNAQCRRKDCPLCCVPAGIPHTPPMLVNCPTQNDGMWMAQSTEFALKQMSLHNPQTTEFALEQMDLHNPLPAEFVMGQMGLHNPQTTEFALGQMNLQNPQSTEFVMGQMSLHNPQTTEFALEQMSLHNPQPTEFALEQMDPHNPRPAEFVMGQMDSHKTQPPCPGKDTIFADNLKSNRHLLMHAEKCSDMQRGVIYCTCKAGKECQFDLCISSSKIISSFDNSLCRTVPPREPDQNKHKQASRSFWLLNKFNTVSICCVVLLIAILFSRSTSWRRFFLRCIVWRRFLRH